MAENQTQILLFIAEDDKLNARRARALRSRLVRAGLECQIVNRLSNDLDELKLVATYRAWELPRWVVIHKGKTEHDECVMPSYNEALTVLESLDISV